MKEDGEEKNDEGVTIPRVGLAEEKIKQINVLSWTSVVLAINA